MKQLELELQERLLLVEYPDYIIEKYDLLEYATNALKCLKVQNDLYRLIGEKAGEDYEIICKGDELTEELLKNILSKNIRIAHKGEYLNPLDEFKFLLESKGFYWDKNPFNNHDWEHIEKWNESESRTFNPSRTLIFKIS